MRRISAFLFVLLFLLASCQADSTPFGDQHSAASNWPFLEAIGAKRAQVITSYDLLTKGYTYHPQIANPTLVKASAITWNDIRFDVDIGFHQDHAGKPMYRVDLEPAEGAVITVETVAEFYQLLCDDWGEPVEKQSNLVPEIEVLLSGNEHAEYYNSRWLLETMPDFPEPLEDGKPNDDYPYWYYVVYASMSATPEDFTIWFAVDLPQNTEIKMDLFEKM